jgi:hypothetical protein
MLLTRLLHSTELNQRLSPGFFLRQGTANILLNGHLDLRSHLRIEFMIKRPFAEE